MTISHSDGGANSDTANLSNKLMGNKQKNNQQLIRIREKIEVTDLISVSLVKSTGQSNSKTL